MPEIEGHYKDCIVHKIKGQRRRGQSVDRICETCGKTFNQRSKYNEHIKRHVQNGEEWNKSLFFYCDKCGKKFNTARELRLHHERLHEGGNYACPSCQMIFSTAAKRKEHQNLEHSTDEKFQCGVCGKRFGIISSLRSHERVHEEPKFECHHCKKKLKSRSALTAHERYHTGEKPFECSMCENVFVSNSRLQQHLAGAHKIVGPRGRQPGWRRKLK